MRSRTALHALKRRLLAEEFVLLRRADEQRRYAASLRRGRVDPNPHQIDAVVFALRRIPQGGCILADEVGFGLQIHLFVVVAAIGTFGLVVAGSAMLLLRRQGILADIVSVREELLEKRNRISQRWPWPKCAWIQRYRNAIRLAQSFPIKMLL
jgi:hypothetical protein